jgi:hypothetical protein
MAVSRDVRAPPRSHTTSACGRSAWPLPMGQKDGATGLHLSAHMLQESLSQGIYSNAPSGSIDSSLDRGLYGFCCSLFLVSATDMLVLNRS